MVQINEKPYDIVIVGAGISGTALTYVLSRYSNLKRIAVVEKYSKPAQVASRSSNNSQTLHTGDIETNYDLKKATTIKPRAEMTLKFIDTLKNKRTILKKMPKMVLGVGEDEVRRLKERVSEFKTLFSDIQLLDREGIAEIEPSLVEGRSESEQIAALYNKNGYAVNYEKLAEAFLAEAYKSDTQIDIFCGEEVLAIDKTEAGYTVETPERVLCTYSLGVDAGVYSLVLARSLGLGCDLSVLPTVGYFYHGPKVLNGKVYMMQKPGLPMAAVHGDSDIALGGKTRFGPRAGVIFWLELGKLKTFRDFLRSAGFPQVFKAYMCILRDWNLSKFMIVQNIYGLPFIGKRLFIKEINRIVPRLKAHDIQVARGTGGVRPQVINIKNESLEFGIGKVYGDKAIFNMTPSPGASIALYNAYEDGKKLVEMLGRKYSFDESKFSQELK